MPYVFHPLGSGNRCAIGSPQFRANCRIQLCRRVADLKSRVVELPNAHMTKIREIALFQQRHEFEEDRVTTGMPEKSS